MRQFYLLFLSISFVSIGLMFSNNSIETTVLNFEKTPSIPKKPTPQKKRKPLVFKDSFSQHNYAESSISNLLAPSITAVKSVTVNGGGNAVPGSQLDYQIVISNTATDALAVTVTDVLASDLTLVAGSLKASPIAVDDSYDCIGNVGITVPAASGVLANDINPVNTSLGATAVNTAGTQGTVVMNPDGSFTFTPNAGFNGATTFGYTVSNGQFARTGTVTINVSTPIWFINGSYAGVGNDGTLAKPFTSVTAFQAINDGANTNKGENGDFIFVYSGTYSSSAVTLRNSQELIGQDATSSIVAITGITVPTHSNTLPSTGGSTVTIANTTATPITLGSGNEIQGCTVTSTSGTTMSGASVGALKVRTTVLSASAGQALQITAGGALDVQFKSITATGASKGISVNSATGSFQVLGTSTTAGSGGTISTMTTRGVEFNSCTNITLKNMNFVNANTTDGTAFATTGISGSNAAMYFNSVNGVSLDNIQMNTTTGNVNAQNGITLQSVTNFSLANSTITRCGTGNEEACIMAINTAGTCTISNSTISKASRCVRFTNNSTNMTLKVTGSTFTDTRTFIDPVTPTPDTQLNANGGAGILVEGFGTSVMSLDVKSSCSFLRIATSGVDALASDDAVVSADVQNCTINSTNANLTVGEDVGVGVHVQSGVRATVKFNILNNIITGRGGDLINVGATATSARMEGTIEGNTINYNFQSSINNNGGSGIGVVHASTNTTSRVKIHNNTITNIAGTSGISATSSGGSSGRADIICTNNNISLITTNYGVGNAVSPANYALLIGSGSSAGQSSVICSKVANNTANSGVIGIARIRAGLSSDTHLVEGSGSTTSAITTNLQLQNIWNAFQAITNVGTIAGTDQIVRSGNASSTITLSPAGTCVAPSNPALNLRIAAPEEVAENQSVEVPSETLITANPIENTEEVAVKDEEDILNESLSENAPKTESTNSGARTMAGETITVNGSTGNGFTIPFGKSTTITFSATVSSTPSTCTITNQASVSGSNFTTVNSTPATTDLIVPGINAGSTISANSVCSGGSINLGATCPSGSQLKWFTTFLSGSSVSTSPTYSPANITTGTAYYASCTIGSCESARTLVGSVTIKALPTISASSNSPVCTGKSIVLTGGTAGHSSYAWSGPNTYTSSTQSPTITGATTAMAGVYTLTVTGTNACTASAVTSVTVNPSPTAAATGAAVCAGNALNLTATGGGTYLWAGPNTFTSTSATPTINNATTAATGTYTVTVTNLGCTATATTTATVFANPTATASSNTPVCSGNTLNLTGGGGGTYLWSGPNSFTSTESSPSITSVTTAATGTYILTVTNVNNCTATAQTVVTINSTPTATASSNTPVSVGGTLNLSSSGGGTYFWTGPNTYTSNVQNPVRTNITTAAAGTYTVTITNAGCTATATTEVVVNTFLASSNSPVCEGSTINLSASGGNSYAWTGPNTFTSTDQNPSITEANILKGGVYTVVIVNSAASATTTLTTRVIISPRPDLPPFTGTTACEGTPLQLETSNPEYVIPGTFLWTGPNGYSSTSAYPLISSSATLGLAGTYSVTVTTPASCTASTTVVITINPKPTTNITVTGTPCVGNTITLNAVAGMAIYSWTGVSGFSSTDQNPTIANLTTNASGTYQVIITDDNECVGTATTNITVNPLPIATATSNSPVCSGIALNLSSVAGMTSYSWTGVNGFTSTDQNPTIPSVTTAANGTYQVVVTNANGCTAMATTSATIITSPSPPATASSSLSTVCIGGSVSLTASCGNGETVTWYSVATGGSAIGTGSPLSIVPSSINTGTFTYYASCKNGTCESSRTATGTVEVVPNLGAGTNLGTTLYSGTLAITDPTFNRSLAKLQTENCTISGVGTSVRYKTHTFTLNQASNVTVTAVDADATGVSVTPSGADTFLLLYRNPFNPASTCTNLIIANDDASGVRSRIVTTTPLPAGTYTVVFTSFNNVPTSSADSPLPWNYNIAVIPSTVGVNFAPSDVKANNVTTPFDVCPNVFVALSATCASGTPTWYNVASGGTALGTGANLSVIPTATSTYYVACENSCSASMRVATQEITFVGLPDAPSSVSASNTAICAGTSIALNGSCQMLPPLAFGGKGKTLTEEEKENLKAGIKNNNSSNNNLVSVGTLKWYTQATGGTSIGTGTGLSVTPSGTTTYYAACENDCGSSSRVATQEVVVTPIPVAPTASNTATCSGSTATLTATCSAGGSVKWYDAASGGALLSSSNTYTTPSLTVQTDYYAACETASPVCVSPTRTKVTVSINALPVATANSNSPICAGTSLNLTTTCQSVVTATLNGASEVPANSSTATGSVTGTFNPIDGKLTVNVTFSGLSAAATAGHIHQGAVGTNGGAIIPFAVPNATSGTFSNTSTLTSAQITALLSGGLYVNIHNGSFPGGEIRGQLAATCMSTYAWTGVNGFSSTAQNPTINNATVSATGTYQVIVTNENGCTAMATTSATVNALPTATASSNSPICSGATLNLTGGGVGTAYAWTSSTGFTSSAQSPTITNATVSVTGTYTITVTNANGCTSTASVAVTVNALPTATASSNSPICAGTTLNLTSGGVGTAYAWTSSNGFTSNVQSPTISNATVSSTGTYTITVTNANGCTSTATVAVTVNSLPTATASSNSPICSGTSLNLTGGGVGTAYAWTSSTGFTSTAQSPTISNATVLATGTYTITVTNVNGCTSTASVAVTVNALPTATASSNSPICSGTTLNLTGGGVGSAYAWTSSTGFTSTAQSPTISNATVSATGTYTITVTNANGCTSTASVAVIVNPVVNAPTPQSDTQIIFGGSVSLTATGCSGSSDVLKWYQTADNVQVTMPVSPTVTTQYYAKCEVTANGITCISPNSNNVTVTVLQPQPPVATGATICTGGSVTLTATGCSGSTGTFVLKWYLNATDALVTMPVSPTTNTDYYAKCEQTFNSVTAISAKSNVVTVTVLNPVAPVATGGTIYSGNSITLTATGCTGSGFVIKWYQTADNVEVTMPVSPTLATQYYAKCEQTANSVTCLSAKSNDVTVVVVNRIFVDITKVAAPIQNGNSWATAYGNLQTGLSAAAAVVVSAPAEVWVAQGTYKPTTTTTRTIYFNIPSGVKVYGGFVGTENDLATRNFRTNTTILSGDIGTIGKDSDNSYHVVNFDASNNNTLLDGFTITGGFASYDPNRIAVAPGIVDLTTTSVETGGGIVVQNAGLPTIANCTIVNNAAVMGGGSFTADASLPKFVACKIMSNRATFGGGVYFQDGSNGSLSNCLISGNQGTGAVYNNKSNTQIMNCTIAGNGGYNGGIFNSVSQPVVKNSIIWNNSTPFNDTQSIITYSTVQGGYAGTGNLSFDPKFVNPVPNGLAPNANGDYHLQASSLAIDRGDNTGISLTDVDLDGNLRRYNGGTVDMGAYEFQGVATSNLIISAQTGNWETNSTWVGFKVPALGDVVIIDSNHIVTINTTATAKSIEYRGTGQVKFNSNTAKLNIGF